MTDQHEMNQVEQEVRDQLGWSASVQRLLTSLSGGTSVIIEPEVTRDHEPYVLRAIDLVGLDGPGPEIVEHDKTHEHTIFITSDDVELMPQEQPETETKKLEPTGVSFEDILATATGSASFEDILSMATGGGGEAFEDILSMAFGSGDKSKDNTEDFESILNGLLGSSRPSPPPAPLDTFSQILFSA